MILPGLPDLVSAVETIGAPAHRPFHVLQRRLQVTVGPAKPSVLEKVDEVLRGHRREAAVGVGGRAGVARVLREARALPHVPAGETAQKPPGLHLNAPGPHRTGVRTAGENQEHVAARRGQSPCQCMGDRAALSLGAGRSPRFPAPQPRTHPGHAAPSAHGGPGSTLELRRAPPTHVPPRAQHHVPRQKHPGLACVRTASGPGGQLGQCLETGPSPHPPSLHPPSGLKAARGTPMVAK